MSDKIINRKHIFFIGLLFYIIRNFFGYTSYPVPDNLRSLCWIVAEMCWIIAIVMRMNFNWHMIIEILLIVWGYINQKITGSSNFVVICFLLFASREIEVKKIVRFMFQITSVLLALDIVMYIVNYALGRVELSQTRQIDGATILRHNFFFNNANGFSFYFFFTVLMFTYVYYDKIKKGYLYGILLVSAWFTYVFPNTRTIALLFPLFILFDLCKGKVWDKVVSKICRHLYIIAFILVIIVVYLFAFHSNAITQKINEAMNGRLTMVAGAYQLYGINLKGHRIINENLYLPNLGYFKLYIDNFYGMLVIRYGLIVTVIVSFFAMITSRDLYKNNKRIELILLSFVFLFGLSESTALDIFPAFPWLFFKETNIYKKDKKPEKIKELRE